MHRELNSASGTDLWKINFPQVMDEALGWGKATPRRMPGAHARYEGSREREMGRKAFFTAGLKAPTSRSKADARASCKRFSKACAEGAQKEI